MKTSFLIFFCLLSTVVVAQKSTVIDAGLATTDITPGHPVMLTGYGDRERPFDSIGQHLYAKALFLGTDIKTAAVIITMDLVGFPAAMADHVASRLAAKTGLKRQQLAFTATHTHCGPETGVLLNISGKPLSGEALRDIKSYRDELENKLEQLVLQAMANREPCQISWTKGSANFSINRRVLENHVWKDFGTTDGPTEHDLPVMRIVNAKGQTKGILLNYACHGTTLVPKHNFVHGDWMGQARQILEQQIPGAIAMVVIGCGADSNPEPRGEVKYVLQHGQTIADEVQRLMSSGKWLPIRSTPSSTFQYIKLEFEQIPGVDTLARQSKRPGVVGMVARNYLEMLARGEEIPTTYDYPIQVMNFGQDLTMVFLGGEVVVDYIKRLKQELGAEKLWANAYSNDVSCYIASRRLYGEGGYEVDGSMVYYNKPSRFKITTEDQIISSVKQAVIQTQGTIHK